MISLISIANWLRLKHFRKNQDGVSAVEFALIAPILILFYLGAAEVSMALLASRRTDHIASSIGDLAAQSDTISHADISDLWNIADGNPKPMGSLQATVAKLSQQPEAPSQSWEQAWATASEMKKEFLSSSKCLDIRRLLVHIPLFKFTPFEDAIRESLLNK